MILHIGNGKTVKHRDIIGIFDLDNVTTRASGKAFIAGAARRGQVFYADDDIPRSFLLLDASQDEGAAVGRSDGRRRAAGKRPAGQSPVGSKNEAAPPPAAAGEREAAVGHSITGGKAAGGKRDRPKGRGSFGHHPGGETVIMLSHISSLSLVRRAEGSEDES